MNTDSYKFASINICNVDTTFRKFMRLSNQTSRCICKCIRITDTRVKPCSAKPRYVLFRKQCFPDQLAMSEASLAR